MPVPSQLMLIPHQDGHCVSVPGVSQVLVLYLILLVFSLIFDMYPVSDRSS